MGNARLSVVKSRIGDLVSRFRKLQSENDALTEKVDQLQAQVLQLENEINVVQKPSLDPVEKESLILQLHKKEAIIDRIEIEKEQLADKVRDLEEMLMLKDNTLQVQKNTINELTEQNKLIKLAKEMSSEKGGNHELKIKINELIRDIDRCIDLLND